MSDILRICVVESDVSLNQNLVHSLREDGHVVQGVLNSADAMRILWSEEYKVVICDQNLSDGFELIRWLRSYRSNVCLIVLGDASKTGENNQHLQALEDSTICYIQKPVDLCMLKDELHLLLQQTGFTASLDSFDLLDVVQIVAMSRKSITLLVDAGLEKCGTLRFRNGDLVWAEYGGLHGEEAFFALATYKNGTVTQHLSDEPFATNVTQPLSRLIFHALQYRTKDAHEQQSLELGLGGTGIVPVLQLNIPASASPPAQFLPNNIDDSPFVFTSEGVAQEDSGPIPQMSQVAPAEPGFSVPQEPSPPIAQIESPVIEQLNFSLPDQDTYPLPLAMQNNAANPYRNKILLGFVITAVILIFLTLAIGTYATGAKTVTERPTSTAIAQAYQKSTITPISLLTPVATPTPIPTPTLAPQVQPTQQLVGVNGNPWGYNFNPGNLIYSPPQNFCDYFDCVRNFWDNTSGYVDECKDGTYSHSGGAPNACVKHGGEMRPLYAH